MVRLRYAVVGIGLLLMSSSGCGVFHNLQSHRLQRLNRGVDGMPASGYFSVTDPIDMESTPTPGKPIVADRTQSTE